MPVVFNLIGHVALGSLLGLGARRSPAFRRDLVSWPLILLVAFHAVIAAPSATFLFRFYPQWSMLYAFDPQVFPEFDDWLGPISAVVVVCNLLLGIAGLYLTRAGILRQAKLLIRLPWLIALLAWVMGLATYGERILWVGSYDAYWQKQAALVFQTVPGWVGAFTYGIAIYFVVWVHRRFGHQEPRYV